MLLTKRYKIIIALIAIPLFLLIIAIYLSNRWIIGISSSDSVFFHILLVDKNDKNVSKGDMVGFYYPGGKMHDYKKGDKFIKFLTCDEGDYLRVIHDSFYCNDKFIAKAIRINSYGEKVKHFRYDGKIPKGKFFAYTSFYYSYDSRYWGFANKSEIIGKGYGVF